MSATEIKPGRKPGPSAATPWDWHAAWRLLHRTGFGASPAEVAAAVDAGLEATVDRLLTPREEAPEFQKTDALLKATALAGNSAGDLKAWWLYRMLYSANPLVEKLTLLWHNHFATSIEKVRSAAFMAQQNELFRRHALGDFKALLHAVARDVAMLIWLDGNANKKRHPNENFARELFELFALGVGNYTEKDIQEAARAFSGWHVRKGEFYFDRGQHDDGPKTVLGTTGRLGGDDVIAICLRHPACSRFLALKLCRAFLSDTPSKASLEHWASRIRAHDYQWKPVLRELFTSREFFVEAAKASIIKSPVDYVLGAYRTLGTRPEGGPHLGETARLLADLGQDLFEPPTVKGWEGGRQWINSAIVLQRARFASDLVHANRLAQLSDPTVEFDKRRLETPKQIVGYCCDLLLGRELDPPVRRRLETYWVESPAPRLARARGLIQCILTLPEFQLG